jgi:hypothetical protein
VWVVFEKPQKRRALSKPVPRERPIAVSLPVNGGDLDAVLIALGRRRGSLRTSLEVRVPGDAASFRDAVDHRYGDLTDSASVAAVEVSEQGAPLTESESARPILW